MRALFLLTLLAGAVGCNARAPESRNGELALAPDGSTQPAHAAVYGAQVRDAANRALDSGRRTAIVDASLRVAPAVVSVVATSRRSRQQQFDFFFVPQTREELVPSYGTGFVVRAEGIILTNQHVVEAAERITVTLPDGTNLPATLVGDDPTTDIAVLRVNQRGLASVTLGRSADLLIGEWVVALGNPYAYLLGNAEPTVTAGVVSAVGRNILPTGDQPGLYLDMIQTDAAINPGNSGGPLANALGEVIGVNSSILSATGGSIGLGFAIPIERALRVMNEILKDGEVHRAYAGLEVAGARSMEITKASDGVRVELVAPEGPAARAGLKTGDVLTQANGRKLRNWLDWEAVRLDLRVGDTVRVRLTDGQTRRLVATDLPSAVAEKVTVLRDLTLLTVTPAVRAERNLASSRGALIYRIEIATSRATGLLQGDVVVAVNNTRITVAEDVAAAFERIKPRQPFRLFFERDRRILYTDLTL